VLKQLHKLGFKVKSHVDNWLEDRELNHMAYLFHGAWPSQSAGQGHALAELRWALPLLAWTCHKSCSTPNEHKMNVHNWYCKCTLACRVCTKYAIVAQVELYTISTQMFSILAVTCGTQACTTKRSVQEPPFRAPRPSCHLSSPSCS